MEIRLVHGKLVSCLVSIPEMPTLLFNREAPYFCTYFCPFGHPNLASSLFLASFVPLKVHVILKTSLFFV